MNAPADSDAPSNRTKSADIPLVEWVIGAIGLVIVLVTLAVLIHEAVAGDQSPPDVKLSVQSVTPLRNGFLVKVTAENQGGEAAARVPFQVELTKENQLLETGGAQFEYLPPHSSRAAGVFFSRDPRDGELKLRAEGYEEP